MNNATPSQLMTTGEVARRLGLSAERVRQLPLPAVRTASGQRIYDSIDVEKLAVERASAGA